MNLDLADIREYVFPLFVAADPARLPPDTPIIAGKVNYLGTAFFVTRNGIAITAAHCVPNPADLPDGKTFIGVIWDGLRARAASIQIATLIPDRDLAVLKVALTPAKYFEVSFEKVHMGSDVYSVGIPLHSVHGPQFEFRYMKGHVTFVSHNLELSYPAPRGMSGSPVLSRGKVVGVLSRNARSEALEDQVEEITENFGPLTRVTQVKTVSVINYGLAEPLAGTEEVVVPPGDGHPLKELITRMNRSE